MLGPEGFGAANATPYGPGRPGDQGFWSPWWPTRVPTGSPWCAEGGRSWRCGRDAPPHPGAGYLGAGSLPGRVQRGVRGSRPTGAPGPLGARKIRGLRVPRVATTTHVPMNLRIQRGAIPILLLTTACAMTGQERALATKHGLIDTRQGIDSMKLQIEGISGALRQIESSGKGTGSATTAYTEFTSKLSALESTANDTRSRAESMKANGDAYFRKWEEELGTIKNPDIRKVSEDRRAELNAAYQKITESMFEARSQFQPYLSDLRDLKTYFSNDLTPAGIKAADPLIRRAVKEGDALQTTGKRLSAEIDKVVDMLRKPQMQPTQGG